jgi:hypothetical protein
MIERWKNLCAVNGRHEFRNLVHTRPVVDMAVGIDDLHVSFLRRDLFAYNNLALPVSTTKDFSVRGSDPRWRKKSAHVGAGRRQTEVAMNRFALIQAVAILSASNNARGQDSKLVEAAKKDGGKVVIYGSLELRWSTA